VQKRLEMPKPLSEIQSYGLAVLAVSVALLGALLPHSFRGAEFTVFLLVLQMATTLARVLQRTA
jgi:hypothetical protein